MEKNILGLITARGNSKGVPKKNIRKLCDKPLIAWTIEAAKICQKLDRVIVSTDNSEIAEICRDYGADVPFMRPDELAEDFSDHMDVMIHGIDWVIHNEKWTPDYVLLLQPTSPLRNSIDISAAIDILFRENADSVISVTETEAHPYFARRVDEDGILVDFMEKPEGYLPRQRLPKVYNENGAIYLARTEVLLRSRSWYTNCTYPYVMPIERSIDIDTLWDFKMAELIMNDKATEN